MAGRSARSVHAQTTHVSRQTVETHAVHRDHDPVIVVQQPASTATRIERVAANYSAAATSASSSFRRRVPPCPPSTALRTFRRAAGASSDGDRVPRPSARVLGRSIRPARAFPRNRRGNLPATGRAKAVTQSPPRDR